MTFPSFPPTHEPHFSIPSALFLTTNAGPTHTIGFFFFAVVVVVAMQRCTDLSSVSFVSLSTPRACSCKSLCNALISSFVSSPSAPACRSRKTSLSVHSCFSFFFPLGLLLLADLYTFPSLLLLARRFSGRRVFSPLFFFLPAVPASPARHTYTEPCIEGLCCQSS
jgi:hypothetical protein